MRRKYRVFYYEYGLTKPVMRAFFTLTGAFLFKLYIDYKVGRGALAVIRELYYE